MGDGSLDVNPAYAEETTGDGRRKRIDDVDASFSNAKCNAQRRSSAASAARSVAEKPRDVVGTVRFSMDRQVRPRDIDVCNAKRPAWQSIGDVDRRA